MQKFFCYKNALCNLHIFMQFICIFNLMDCCLHEHFLFKPKRFVRVTFNRKAYKNRIRSVQTNVLRFWLTDLIIQEIRQIKKMEIKSIEYLYGKLRVQQKSYQQSIHFLFLKLWFATSLTDWMNKICEVGLKTCFWYLAINFWFLDSVSISNCST